MRKGLLISFCFLPESWPESILSAKKIGGLKDCQFDVFCVQSMSPVNMDLVFEGYLSSTFNKVIRYSPPKFYQKLPFSRLKLLFSQPDNYRWLLNSMLKTIENVQDYDFVLSWSNHLSAHLLANKLVKKHPKLKWLAHFSDPWCNNPYNSWSFLLRALNRRLEEKVFARADKLMVTSPETKALYAKHYSQKIIDKVALSPHCYDPVLYDEVENQVNQSFVISYLGGFYGKRSPLPLFKAILHLLKTAPEILQNVQIELVGGMQFDFTQNQVYQQIPEGLIKIKKPVGYLESLQLMRRSNLLLVIDAPFEPSVFLPSKLVDYIGANKPIFGIVPQGASRRVIENLGGTCQHPHDSELIACRLGEVVKQHKKEKAKSWGDTKEREKYTLKKVCADLDSIISDTIN